MNPIAINICGDIHVANNMSELEYLIDMGIPYTVIGKVCPNACNTDCLHYRMGTCPYRTMKDFDGHFIHVLVE